MSLLKVENAIILAAGIGSRLVPVTYELPHGLVPIRGEPLIERQIRQLLEKGITEIIIVVGYLKEQYEYLIDKYGVQLILNPEFSVKNSLASLFCARSYLKNSYILFANNWINENIFNSTEEKSWCSCVYKTSSDSDLCVTTDDAGRIIDVAASNGCVSWVICGPVFLSKTLSQGFAKKIEEYYKKPGKEDCVWEDVFVNELHHFDLYINRQSVGNVQKFKTLEELRWFDPGYYIKTQNSMINTIKDVFGVKESKIVDIQNLETGMTNRSFAFSLNEKSYIFRMPGEGTEELINRKQESEVYRAVKNLRLSDEIVLFDEETGYKISTFYENARNTDPHNRRDIELSMEILRRIHQSGIRVAHSFDIDKEIIRYLALCDERNALRFQDNEETYEKMKVLIEQIQKMHVQDVLCHIDCNPDNFIRLADGSIKLVDWEYAGMGDPIMDVSMYSIYSYYSKEDMDELLKIYLERDPNKDERLRLYIYTALGGYLWALWTEYKQSFDVEFGGYGARMYQYAKDFYDLLQQENI